MTEKEILWIPMKVLTTKPIEVPIQEYCGREGELKFAGIHLLVELWNSSLLNNPDRISEILSQAVKACGATLLSMDLHVFTPYGGVTGIAALKESHISIHTWPEYGYAALDIFVCGSIDPHLAVPVLKKGFQPEKMEIREIKRGILS